MILSRTKMLILMTALSGGVTVSCARAEGEVTRSPFVPEGNNTAGPAAPTENAPLELRGIVSTKTGYLFGLYDPSKRQSVWIRQNEPGAEFTVRSHDVANDTVNVEYQGRTLTLALKSAKVESIGPMANPAQVNLVRAPNQMMNQPPQPGMANPSAADEARRLEGVAAEVRRRRMLRQAAQQQGGTQQTPMPPPPMPGPHQPNAQPMPR